MTKRKKVNAQDVAFAELAEFPNFFAWVVLSPAGKKLTGASHEEKLAAYEAAFEELLQKVVEAAAELEGKPCDR